MKHGQRIIRRLLAGGWRINSISILEAVRRGFTFAIPLLLTGSFALLLQSLQIPAYQAFMTRAFGSSWQDFFLYVRDGTFNIIALVVAFGVGYCYASNRSDPRHYVSPGITALVSLGSFAAMSGISRAGFEVSSLGVTGVFAAVLTSSLSTLLFCRLCMIPGLRMRAFADGAGATFAFALSAVVPAIVTIAVFAGLNQVLFAAFHAESLQVLLSGAMVRLFSGISSRFSAGMLFVLLVHALWFFGIHGSNVMEPVAQHVFLPVTVGIFSKTFIDSFVLMGGCGAALALVCANLISGQHKNQIHLVRLSAVPLVFNINELIMFGLPVVLNPAYLIPFVGVPLLLALISYGAVAVGLVPPVIHQVEWTTPVFLSGYIATGSLRGSLLQFFNLAVGTVCYIPFVRLSMRMSERQMRENMDKLCALYRAGEERGAAAALLTRQDEMGSLCRSLLSDLEYDLNRGRLRLFYQPILGADGRVTSAEGLLRWKHASYGYVYPPLVIALAEESGLIGRLDHWIAEQGCRDLDRLRQMGIDISVSVNMTMGQLERASFAAELKELLRRYEIPPGQLQMEITERDALVSCAETMNRLMDVKKLGVRLAMDDFGMGHSSLMYLKEYPFDTVKLDGSLIREIVPNRNCRHIVSTITQLGRSLRYTVVAEYVEDERQREVLHELGCDQYQGYLYSKAIPFGALVAFIRSRMWTPPPAGSEWDAAEPEREPDGFDAVPEQAGRAPAPAGCEPDD